MSFWEKLFGKDIGTEKIVKLTAETAVELTDAAKQEQIKEGLERIDRQILSSAQDGHYRFYTTVFDSVCAEAREIIVTNLRERRFEVDPDRGIVSWKSGVLFKKETFGKE